MLHIRHDELGMFKHAAETTQDRIHNDCTGYTDADQRAVNHIDVIGTRETSALVVTGDELLAVDAMRLFRQVVAAELKHWVPDASQRLLHRAAGALGVQAHGGLVTSNPDCGAEPGWHALTADWVAGIFVRRCVTCARLYADGTPE
ncbi:hypothetical protein SEA_XKCD426_36 [Streptomyces phage Xkcd426]|nr:hypothetical protein SEA_XKCD426_36 [Streptomyces phage Xkcd426]